MSKSGLNHIGVCGIGQMGGGIAQVAAQHGFKVSVLDVNEAALEAGFNIIKKSLDRLVKRHEEGKPGGMTKDEMDAAVARIHITTKHEDMVSCDIIIEAIVERLDVKLELFRKLTELGYNNLWASNTSSISITTLANSVKDPTRFMGMHFMNPVPMMKGVEVIRGFLTSNETNDTILALCEDLEKTAIPAEDKAGFMVNRIWAPFVNEAIRAIEEGIASVDAVDNVTICLAHQMGPLMTADYVGLDTMLNIFNVLEAELGDKYKAAPLIRRLVDSGNLGRKSGMGFYKWEGFKTVGLNPAVERYRIK